MPRTDGLHSRVRCLCLSPGVQGSGRWGQSPVLGGGLVVVPHCKTPADQPSGISCSAPGSTVSRHTLTSTTGDGWCWTCRYGESSCLGARRSVQGNTVGAASVKGGSTYTHSTQTPCPCGAWRSIRRMDGRSLTPQPGPGFSHHTSSQHALGTKA